MSAINMSDKEMADFLQKLRNRNEMPINEDEYYLIGEIAERLIEFSELKTELKEQEVRELTIDEWREWKANSNRNPICKLWENDISPMWILNPNDVHEPALLMGKLKLFTGKPAFEQCKEVKWNENISIVETEHANN